MLELVLTNQPIVSPGTTETAPDLDFPDWSGQRELPSRASVAQTHRLSESYLPWVVTRPDFDLQRLREKIAVEFVL